MEQSGCSAIRKWVDELWRISKLRATQALQSYKVIYKMKKNGQFYISPISILLIFLCLEIYGSLKFNCIKI